MIRNTAEYSRQEYYSEQQESNFFPAKMQKVYTNCTAAVLRAKDCVMKIVSKVQENAEDIYAEAQQINEDRAAAEEVVEDTADEAAEETEETTDFKEETEETEEGSEE